MIDPAFEILNQRGTPMFFSDVFANRPTAGIVGRIFISTDTYAFYRDTGSGWDLIGGPGTGTITGSGTAGTLPLWNGTSTISNSDLRQLSTKALILNSATNDWPTAASAEDSGRLLLTSNTNNPTLIAWGKSAFGSGDEQGSLILGNVTALGSTTLGGAIIDGYIENGTNGSGSLRIRTTNALGLFVDAIITNSSQNTTFYGNIIRNGGLSTQFLKADGSLDSNTYNTGSGAASQVAFWSSTNALSGENNLWWDSTNNYLGINTNTPSVPLDVHHSGNNGAILNQTTATNNNLIAFQTSGNGRWRIGNFYNAGADDYGIFDVIGNIQPFTIAKTTGQTFIGSKITASGRLVINSASSDAHLQVVGANAPSIRIDNAGTGATQRFVMGLATATNNFIQGSTAGDICISTASASPLLFGMWQSINASEVMRISTSNNLLLGSVVDAGYKLDVNGTTRFRNSVLIENASTPLTIRRSAISGQESAIRYNTNGTDYFYAGLSDGSNNYRIYNTTTGVNSLNISSSTDAATFSSTLRVQDVFYGADGSSSSASIRFWNSNAGLFYPGSDALGFSTGVNEAGRFTSARNLLLGTTTDGGQKLQVNGTTKANQYDLNAKTIANSTTTNLAAGHGGYVYFEGTLANTEKCGQAAGTFQFGYYLIFAEIPGVGRGHGLYIFTNTTASSGFTLISGTGLTWSTTYNAAASVSFAYDGALGGPFLVNNTGVQGTFRIYIFGGS